MSDSTRGHWRVLSASAVQKAPVNSPPPNAPVVHHGNRLLHAKAQGAGVFHLGVGDGLA